MAEYDKIAKDYIRSEETRLERIYIIDPSFIKIIENVDDKTILNLACGDGNFSRKLKKAGAKKVVGLDISKEMLKIAEEKTKEERLDIKYIEGDVAKLEKIDEFDLVTAAFLLHYSKTYEELQQMCNNIYNNLKEDGRFITLNASSTPKKDIKEFGAKIEGPENLEEGDALVVKLYENMKESCSFTIYHWSKETYETCLKKAGFKRIKWHNLKISKKGLEKYPEKNWEKFTKNSYVIIIEATK